MLPLFNRNGRPLDRFLRRLFGERSLYWLGRLGIGTTQPDVATTLTLAIVDPKDERRHRQHDDTQADELQRVLKDNSQDAEQDSQAVEHVADLPHAPAGRPQTLVQVRSIIVPGSLSPPHAIDHHQGYVEDG